MNTKTQKKMIKVRFKAIQGVYGFFTVMIFLVLWGLGTYVLVEMIGDRTDKGPPYWLAIPAFVSLGVSKLIAYYIFADYYEFSYEENKLIIRKEDNILQQIPIQYINNVRFSYELSSYASNMIIHMNDNKIGFAMGGIATNKKDTIKAKYLITEKLKPILLENSFQENIIEKGEDITYEYVKL